MRPCLGGTGGAVGLGQVLLTARCLDRFVDDLLRLVGTKHSGERQHQAGSHAYTQNILHVAPPQTCTERKTHDGKSAPLPYEPARTAATVFAAYIPILHEGQWLMWAADWARPGW